MIGIPIKYETFDDEPETITEKFWFHFSKREWVEMQIADEPMDAVIKKIIESKSNQQIFNYMKEIILKAYGVRVMNSDGKMTKFKKSEEIRKEFEDSAAFDALIEDMIEGNTAEKLATFITGILPKDITETPEYAKVMSEAKVQVQAEIDSAAAEASSKETHA